MPLCCGVGEDSQSPLDSKEFKSVNPKGNQSWIFIRRTEAETPILWPRDVKSRLMCKDPDVGQDWRQEEQGSTEDESVGWHHWFNGHEFEQSLGDGEGQGSLVCCTPWGHKVLDTTESLNNNKLLLAFHKTKIELNSYAPFSNYDTIMLKIMIKCNYNNFKLLEREKDRSIKMWKYN